MPPGAVEIGATLEAIPGKIPLVRRAMRPPNYETPIELFPTPLTPNRAFFVRWHLANIPERIRPTACRRASSRLPIVS